MLSNRLGVSKIVVFTDQAVKEFFKPGPAYLLQMDGVKFINGAFYWGLINGYSKGFFLLARGLGSLHLGGGNVMRPFDWSNRSRLRQTMFLGVLFACRQFHALQTSFEMNRLLASG